MQLKTDSQCNYVVCHFILTSWDSGITKQFWKLFVGIPTKCYLICTVCFNVIQFNRKNTLENKSQLKIDRNFRIQFIVNNVPEFLNIFLF